MPQKSEGARLARERALRMLALQIIQQLPDSQDEAHRVLELAKQELDDFVHFDPMKKPKQFRVV